MFDPLFNGLAWLLAFFYDLFDDLVGRNAYALAIVGLTLTIMVVFTPLTIKGTRSMMQMSTLQPEIKRLQAAHRGDRQKLNEEMMKLYQAHGVNPLGGCLPTLIQIPVFFVLYRVVSGMTEMNAEGTGFAPKYLDSESQLYKDLVADDEMRSFGMDLARSANDVLRESFVDALPYLGLILVTFALAWYQQRQMKARRSSAAAPNRQMEVMMKVLPFMLPVFSFIVQAALAVYFVASSLYRIGQQAYIHHSMAAKAGSGPSLIDVDVADEKPKKPRLLGRGNRAGRAGTAGNRARGNNAKQAQPPREIADASATDASATDASATDASAIDSGAVDSSANGSAAGEAPAAQPTVSNERSKKAIDAEQQRLAERAARSAARRASGSAQDIGSARVPKQKPAAQKPASQNSGGKNSGGRNSGNKGGSKSGGKSGQSSNGTATPNTNAGSNAVSNAATNAESNTSPNENGVDHSNGVAGAAGDGATANGTDATPVEAVAAGAGAKRGLRSMLGRNGRNGKDNGRNGRNNGRRSGKGKAAEPPTPKPIQSRRTSGDGRSRKKRS